MCRAVSTDGVFSPSGDAQGAQRKPVARTKGLKTKREAGDTLRIG